MLRVVLVDPGDAVTALAELDTADGAPLRVLVIGEAGAGSAPPADCLTVTADADRAAAARAAGLPVVQVGVDVPGWPDVPRLVARLLDPGGVEAATFAASLRAHGQLAEPGVDAPAATHRVADGEIERERFRAI